MHISHNILCLSGKSLRNVGNVSCILWENVLRFKKSFDVIQETFGALSMKDFVYLRKHLVYFFKKDFLHFLEKDFVNYRKDFVYFSKYFV